MNTHYLGKTFADREIIVQQGEAGECMYAIQAGCVEVVRETADEPVRLAVLQEGEIFGEMAIFERKVRSATVRALGRARVLTIDRKTFLKRVQEDPSLALNLAKMLCDRVRRLNIELEKLVRTTDRRAQEPVP